MTNIRVRGLFPKFIIFALIGLSVAATMIFFAGQSEASHGTACNDLPSHDRLEVALIEAQGEANGGFGFHMWGTVVNRDGVVCAVASTGQDRGDQWPGSRIISAQKANTANSFSLPGFALSTANLFSAVQPGGSLFGLQHSNPVNTIVAYGGNPDLMGTHDDPMVGKRIGGVNVFGGGLALYTSEGTLIGAIGVSGDSSCADHNIAWRTRDTLGLDNVPAGVGSPGDNIVYDATVDSATGHTATAGGWGHPACTPDATAVAEGFATTHPIGP